MKNKYKIFTAVLFTMSLWQGASGQNGALDITFNGTGKVFSTTQDNNNDVKIQSDGKIVTVGTTNDGTNTKMKVKRVLSNGTIDPTFGTGGVFTYLFGNEASASDCHILPSGKIVVVGYSYLYSANQNIVVLQLNANGTLDAGFGTGGVATLNPGMQDIAYGVTVLGNGSILVAGESSSIVGFDEVRYATIAKLNANGTVDASFGTSGYAKVTGYVAATGEGRSSKFQDVKVQSDGKIIGIGQQGYSIGSNYACLIARLSANGILDASYGTAGKIVKNINGLYDSFYDAELTSTNDLIVTGSTQLSTTTVADFNMLLAKYNSNGQPFPGFGTNGLVTVTPTSNIKGNGTGGLTMAIQPDGKILVGGNCDGTVLSNQNYAVWRLSAAGVLDNTFGTSGLAKFDFGPSGRDEAAGIALQADNKIVVVGGSVISGLKSTLIRLTNTIPVALTLNLTAFIEGFYNGTTMLTSNAITVELHSGTSPYAIVATANGTLSTAGTAALSFYSGTSATNYYIVIKHRNAIQTWSALASFTAGALSYNFTTAANKAFGSNMILKGGEWCIYSGDVNQDGTVDLLDMTPIDNDASNFDYHIENDLNGDTSVDLNDMTFVDNNSSNFISLVKP